MATSWVERKIKHAATRFALSFVPAPVQKAAARVKKITAKKPEPPKKTKAAPKERKPQWVGPKVKVPPPPKPSRSKVIRQAKMEWSNDGERLVPELQHQGLEWKERFVAPEDQDHYRGLVQSCWIEFSAWPNDAGNIEALHKAVMERALYLYGEYALTWEVQDIQLIESAADRAAGETRAS